MMVFDKHEHPTRRQVLAAAAAGVSGLAVAASLSSSAIGAGAGEKGAKKVRYSDLLPHELRQKLDEKPLAYLPLGTLEQHGPHLALGADAIQSEALMLHERPDLVDMSRLPKSRSDWPVGVGRDGEDPRNARAEHGRQCMEASLEMMVKMFRDAGV